MVRNLCHDTYRLDKGGAPTLLKVLRAAHLLQEHKVEYNILKTVNAANADHYPGSVSFLTQ